MASSAPAGGAGAGHGDVVPRTERELRLLADAMGIQRAEAGAPKDAEPVFGAEAAAELNAMLFSKPLVRPECTCMQRVLDRKAFFEAKCPMHTKAVKGATRMRVKAPRINESSVVARLDEFEERKMATSVAVQKTQITRELAHEMLEKYTLFLQQTEPWSRDMAEVFSRRATLFAVLHAHEKARRDALKCTQLDPTYVPGHYRLGMALYAQRKYDQAAEAFLRGLKYSPDNCDLRRGFDTSMAQARMRRNRPGIGGVAPPPI